MIIPTYPSCPFSKSTAFRPFLRPSPARLTMLTRQPAHVHAWRVSSTLWWSMATVGTPWLIELKKWVENNSATTNNQTMCAAGDTLISNCRYFSISLSQWLNFKLFGNYIFSRENKVQTFFFRVHWLSEP